MDQPAQGAAANRDVRASQRGSTVEEILLSQGDITQEQFNKVRLESVNKGRKVDELILEYNYASEQAVVKARAMVMGIEFSDVAHLGASPEALGMIPESVAKRYQVLPFALDKVNGVLSVAMANPADLTVMDFVQAKSGMKIQPFMAVAGDLKIAIEQRYTESLSGEVTEALEEGGVAQTGITTVDSRSLGELIKEAPIAKIVSTVLEFAIKARASDVHIEPQNNRTRIRYRIDGILQEKLVLPKSVHDAVISRIKILAGMKIDEKRLPQDGRFNFVLGDEEVDLRVSSLPTVNGEKIVMRLLKKSGQALSLLDLGLRGKALSHLQEAVKVSHGILLITGPTGSGKTTTLYSILSIISTTKVNVVTLEDPVEYQIEGVNQVQVNPAAGLTFASGLRSFLRQDPNIIMVGEIRDEETADLAIQASLTGHVVFATLHTNDSAGALPRLLDMKAEPYLLASSITAVVAQRVVRMVCNNCRTAYIPEKEVIDDIKRVLGPLYEAWRQSHPDAIKLATAKNAEIVLYRGQGEACKVCGGTGYKGRVGIYEVMPVTAKIGQLIMQRATSSTIADQAVAEGMILMTQDGYMKALEGITTIDEVLRVSQT